MDGSDPAAGDGAPWQHIAISAPLRQLVQRALMERSDHLLDALTRLSASTEGHDSSPDPEAVHDLRVASRRLREALATYRPLLPKASRRQLSAVCRDVRDALGEIRNLEIITEWMAQALRRVTPVQAVVLEGLLARARADLARERAAIGPRLARLGLGRLDHTLAELVDGVAPLLPAPPEAAGAPDGTGGRAGLAGPAVAGRAPAAPAQDATRGNRADQDLCASREARDFAVGMLREARARARAAERALAGGAPEPLHRLRIRLKRLRYRSECFTALSPASLADCASRMRERQDLLGRMQDLHVLMLYLTALQAEITGPDRTRRVTAIGRLVARARNQRAATHATFAAQQRRCATSRLAVPVEEELSRG